MEIQIEMTNRCNLNCKHCSNGISGVVEMKDISFEQVKAFVALAPDGTSVFLSGGEPQLLNIPVISKALVSNGNVSKVGMFTSGIVKDIGVCSFVTEAESIKHYEAGLRSAFFSIYHVQDELHDAIVGQKGALAKTLQTMSNYQKAGIRVKAHLVVNQLNATSLDHIIYKLQKHGLDEVRLLRLVKTGTALAHWDLIGLGYQEQNRVITRVYNAQHNYGIKLSFSGFPALTACRRGIDAIGCQAGTRLLYVTVDGEVFPCACTRNDAAFKIGHISDVHFFKDYFASLSNVSRKRCLNELK